VENWSRTIPNSPSNSKPYTALAFEGVRFKWQETEFGLTIDAFRIQKGERLLLVGESGGGKSTLLSLACGVLRADAGQISVMGDNIGDMQASQVDRMRADRFGVIFQIFNLLPFASAVENVLLPLRFAKGRRRGTGDAEARDLLSRLRVPEDVHDAKASLLSVGQQQRVAAARALIGSPPIVLADEPTSALDRRNASDFMELLIAELEEAGGTLLMVSHDESLAPFFDRTVPLGSIAQVERRDIV